MTEAQARIVQLRTRLDLYHFALSNSMGDPLHKMTCEWRINAVQRELDLLEHAEAMKRGH